MPRSTCSAGRLQCRGAHDRLAAGRSRLPPPTRRPGPPWPSKLSGCHLPSNKSASGNCELFWDPPSDKICFCRVGGETCGAASAAEANAEVKSAPLRSKRGASSAAYRPGPYNGLEFATHKFDKYVVDKVLGLEDE